MFYINFSKPSHQRVFGNAAILTKMPDWGRKMKTKLIDRTERLTFIERMLFDAPTGLRVVEIAHACGVDRRTIYRDLAVLTNIGLPVYQKDGRFFINLEEYLVTVRLNLNEAMALFMAIRTLSYHTEKQNPYLVSALKKLGVVLPDLPSRHIHFFAETLRNDTVDRNFITVLETMTRAWAERRMVEVWYSASSGQEAVSREFATYFIEITPMGSIFAIGYDSLSQNVQPLRIRRIVRARLLRTLYDIPAHFNPRRYLAILSSGINDEIDETLEIE